MHGLSRSIHEVNGSHGIALSHLPEDQHVIPTIQQLRTPVRFHPPPQHPKVNHSRLAFLFAGSCVLAGVSAEVCGLRDPGFSAGQGPILLSLAPSSLALCCVKILKSASTEISFVTNQKLTRGLFKRLDGVIA